LSDKDLKQKLQSIIGEMLDPLNDGILKDDRMLQRNKQRKYRKITIHFYDCISTLHSEFHISPTCEGKSLIQFNKLLFYSRHFKEEQ